VAAVQRWLADGVPPNPGGWLTTTANRKAIDRIRHENNRAEKQKQAQLLCDDDPPDPAGAIDDERLRLIFTCCHPALAMQTRVALTLRMVAGLSVPEIARAFLDDPAQRARPEPARPPGGQLLRKADGRPITHRQDFNFPERTVVSLSPCGWSRRCQSLAGSSVPGTVTARRRDRAGRPARPRVPGPERWPRPR
jgi:hypothetical protein